MDEEKVLERLRAAEARIAALEGRTGRIMAWFRTIFPRPVTNGPISYLKDMERAQKAWDALFAEEET